jgi:hypothetical protein
LDSGVEFYFHVCSRDPLMPHGMPEGSIFFLRVFLSGLDSRLFFLRRAYYRLVLTSSVAGDSPRDKRGRSGSRNRGLRFGIRVDIGRFVVGVLHAMKEGLPCRSG